MKIHLKVALVALMLVAPSLLMASEKPADHKKQTS